MELRGAGSDECVEGCTTYLEFGDLDVWCMDVWMFRASEGVQSLACDGWMFGRSDKFGVVIILSLLLLTLLVMFIVVIIIVIIVILDIVVTGKLIK